MKNIGVYILIRNFYKPEFNACLWREACKDSAISSTFNTYLYYLKRIKNNLLRFTRA